VFIKEIILTTHFPKINNLKVPEHRRRTLSLMLSLSWRHYYLFAHFNTYHNCKTITNKI